MQIKFWGVRGSVAVGGPEVARVGGNTACVELSHAGHSVILDGGTGLAALGRATRGPVDSTILFTHVHWDHIQGVPFYAPLFHPQSRVRLMGQRTHAGGLRDALDAQMRPPAFPVGLDAFAAQMSFHDVVPSVEFDVGPFRVRAVAVDHPDGVLAYRISAGGRVVVFATDIEHGDALDPELIALARGADVLIHDAQYTDREYRGDAGPSRVGWGHSTWEQAVACAQAAEVDRLALFHHDPDRDDAGVAEIEQRAQERQPRTFAAREQAPVAV
ncbi:MAG: phosphoribosyl 1,2-cyclic phosphodiesterase [Myxococcota bacterium]|jgi:phosphoribosyl 1,2-cyclic phosphodiesterase